MLVLMELFTKHILYENRSPLDTITTGKHAD
eukprot:COSAG01_NODE_68078_length_265_cov_0.620482_1_plen_30_part_01